VARSGPETTNGTTLVARVKSWVRDVKRDILALWLAARDPRVPWYAKAMAACVAAYALSPIDLIPDFIPVLGYLDDLVIVPIGIVIAVWMIPEPVMRDLRDLAQVHNRPVSGAGLVLVLIIWLLVGAMALRWLWSAL